MREIGERFIENYIEIIFRINFFRIFFEIFFSIFFLFFGLYNFLAAQNRPPYSVSQNTRLFGPRNVYSPIALGTNTYSFNIYKYRSHHWLIFGRDVSLGNQRSHWGSTGFATCNVFVCLFVDFHEIIFHDTSKELKERKMSRFSNAG